MSMSEKQTYVHRREDRYSVKQPGEISIAIVVQNEDDDASESYPGELHDFSTSGAKLHVSSRLPTKSEFVLKLEIPAAETKLELKSVVRWMRPRGDGTWWIGCVFPEQIDESVVEGMCTAGYLERRRAIRSGVEASFQTRWENTQGGLPTQMIDASDGGFCLVVSQKFEPGERLMLETTVDGEVQSLLCARAKWVKKRENDYLLGCEFINRSGYSALQPFINSETAEAEVPEETEKRGSRWIWWGAGSAASAAAMIWALLKFGM
jgi:hypothetical protein